MNTGGPILAHELRSIGVFSQLTDAEVERILPLMRRRSVGSRRSLRLKETLSGRVWFVCSGQFRIVASPPHGSPATLYTSRLGDVIGHVVSILGKELGASLRLVADEGGDLLEMNEDHFLALVDEIKSVRRATMRHLAAAVENYVGQLFDLAALAVRSRLIAELLRLSRQGVMMDGVCVVERAPTHAILASQIGASREVVTRHLRELERDGLVRRRGRALEFLDPPKLMALNETEVGERPTN